VSDAIAPTPRWRGQGIVEFGMRRSRSVIIGVVLLVIVLGALMVRVATDTDPENMLPSDDPVRELNRSLRSDFGVGDVLAVGIVDDGGVLEPELLTSAVGLIEAVNALDGVVAGSVVSFMSAADVPPGPLSQSDVDTIANAADANPLLAGRVLAPDGTALGIFVTLESKDVAKDVAASVDRLVGQDAVLSDAEVYTAGLPLAEEEFGRNMFVQMAVLAPLAGLFIFLLMFYFFRNLTLVVAAMIVAMLSVIWTMGLLIGTGFTLHIMSSMIPIFLMPIAILDSVHILSEFFDRYPHYNDREMTLRAVYRELFMPITFTSLTTAIAFSSLMLVPIPPVRVFGAFVAFGVGAAWLLTVVFLPAFVMRLDEQRLQRLSTDRVERSSRVLTGGLRRLGHLTTGHPRTVLIVFGLVVIAAIPGVTQIVVNDNPVRWFRPGTGVREATEELNRRFPGTYNASLVLEAEDPGDLTRPETVSAVADLQEVWGEVDVIGSTSSYVDLAPKGGDAGEVATALDAAEADPHAALAATLITPDRLRANIQLLLSDGDNQSMQRVVDSTDDYLSERPLPDGITAVWAGETYLNLVWQDKMVSGMAAAFLGTLAVVFGLMIVLFRSLVWALLAMVPVLSAVLVVYGVAGWAGKDYDMPMAVLSTLVLGIGVDFAIHFTQRYREFYAACGTAREALARFYEEPARALTRNALVIAIGFLPLFASTLVPYLTVGAFLVAIVILSWLATLFVLPSAVVLAPARPTPQAVEQAATSRGRE